MSAAGSLNDVVGDLLALLDDFFPPAPGGSLPDPTVQVVASTQREVGLGRWRGTETAANFAVIALKGVQLDAIVRYQLWASDPNGVSSAVSGLQRAVLGARETLRGSGVLDLSAHEMGVPTFESGVSGWYVTANFRVLFEYRYQDDDGADSVIARIPIDVDPERSGSPDREHLEVTDAMVRWDAIDAPDLLLRTGGDMLQVGHLSVLALLPPLPADPTDPTAWHGAPVVLAVQQGGARRRQVFATVRAFADAFSSDAQVQLGTDIYVSGTLGFPMTGLPGPIALTRAGDFLQVTYTAAAFDNGAVLYLRAHP